MEIALTVACQSFLGEILSRFGVRAQVYAIDIGDGKLRLYKAAINGNISEAIAIFSDHSEKIMTTTRINQLGETALHIATAADRTEFVQKLVDVMSSEDLAVINNRGDTALVYAAISGHATTAKVMLKKNSALATIRDGENFLPIQAAAMHGHHRMVRHIYDYAKDQLVDDGYRIDVLIALIQSDEYDYAIEMVEEKPWLTAKANNNGETALSTFARKPRVTPEKLMGKNIFQIDKLRTQGFELLKLVLQPVMSGVEENLKLIKEALFIAAKQGNWEFLAVLIHSDPGLAFEVDENRYTIFHIAVLHRHLKVFNLIQEINSTGSAIKLMKDNDGNNILHLAGKMPLEGVVQGVPGAALQLLSELLWFEKVKKRVGSHKMEARNRKGKTPLDLFTEEHKGLQVKGEEWMKATANSCMVVSTLVAGVAFASAVTLPGGNGEDTGAPIFLHSNWFQIFAVANAVSLIFSASSILFFLAVFTSQYSMNDFKWSLPLKFFLGLCLLFGAVQAMIVAFAAACFITFKNRLLDFAYPISVIAAIPVLFFVFLLYPFLIRVIHSTFTGFFLSISKITNGFSRAVAYVAAGI
ncbi:Ankyrin repeat family protein [Euphorbia peplus]|nr:Ankyrin repeat family protein [Euphorbia peplus]